MKFMMIAAAALCVAFAGCTKEETPEAKAPEAKPAVEKAATAVEKTAAAVEKTAGDVKKAAESVKTPAPAATAAPAKK